MRKPTIDPLFDPATFTISYVVGDPETGVCAVIDPVLDYDPASGRTARRSADQLMDMVRARDYRVAWILETHAHADHLSGAQAIRERLGGRIAIGEHIRAVQARFGPLFNFGPDFATDGSQFDHLFADGDAFTIGGIEATVMHTPGHTPACVSYLIGDACFVGDTLFMPDYGTARADFPGGDARTLFRSIQRLHALPPETRLFMCHDYQPGGRAVRWETTVADSRADNRMVRDGVEEDLFVEHRKERDSALRAPALILPSLQVNIAAGRLPEPEGNGIRYLRVPLDQLGGG